MHMNKSLLQKQTGRTICVSFTRLVLFINCPYNSVPMTRFLRLNNGSLIGVILSFWPGMVCHPRGGVEQGTWLAMRGLLGVPLSRLIPDSIVSRHTERPHLANERYRQPHQSGSM